MRWATHDAGVLEREILGASGAGEDALARARLPGSRRAARIFPREVEVDAAGDALRLRFRLPKGAYATVVLREITKSPD